MHLIALLMFFFAPLALADADIEFLGTICLKGFEKTSMPRDEAARFCKCVQDDIRPQLNARQRTAIRDARSKLERGQKIPDDYFIGSGVRDLVVAGQARCETAFYPPSQPITLKSGKLEMTLRCEGDSQGPEIFIYIRDGQLLTKKEHDNITERMMKDNFDPEYAKVSVKINARPPRTELWEIDITGQIVAPPKSHNLLVELRTATSLEVNISRGGFRYQGTFMLTDKIPPRWVPCGGVTGR